MCTCVCLCVCVCVCVCVCLCLCVCVSDFNGVQVTEIHLQRIDSGVMSQLGEDTQTLIRSPFCRSKSFNSRALPHGDRRRSERQRKKDLQTERERERERERKKKREIHRQTQRRQTIKFSIRNFSSVKHSLSTDVYYRKRRFWPTVGPFLKHKDSPGHPYLELRPVTGF